MSTTQTQHTKGPWRLVEDPDGNVSIQTDTLKICTVGYAGLFPAAEADARLIAAAPDLLDALKDIPMDCDHLYPHLMACWVCTAKAAIAKAEGA